MRAERWQNMAQLRAVDFVFFARAVVAGADEICCVTIIGFLGTIFSFGFTTGLCVAFDAAVFFRAGAFLADFDAVFLTAPLTAFFAGALATFLTGLLAFIATLGFAVGFDFVKTFVTVFFGAATFLTAFAAGTFLVFVSFVAFFVAIFLLILLLLL